MVLIYLREEKKHTLAAKKTQDHTSWTTSGSCLDPTVTGPQPGVNDHMLKNKYLPNMWKDSTHEMTMLGSHGPEIHQLSLRGRIDVT